MTGINADSNAVRSAVIAPEIRPWNRNHSLTRSVRSVAVTSAGRPDDTDLVAAIHFDDCAVDGHTSGEIRRHQARNPVLPADDPDVTRRRARHAHDGGELVENRSKERRAGILDSGNHTFCTGVHQAQDVVRRLQHPPDSAHRFGAEHDRSVSQVPHGRARYCASCDPSGVDSRPLLLQLRLRGKIDHHDHTERAATLDGGHASERGSSLVLSPEGRLAANRIFRLEGEDETAAVTAYEQFRPRNTELIQTCSDWQMRPGAVVNDHRDATYDWSVIDRLAIIDDRIGPVIRRLGKAVENFADYRSRLRDARTQLEAGNHDWFTSPRIDSYHTVWMELHEHLLVGLGIERGAEAEDAR